MSDESERLIRSLERIVGHGVCALVGGFVGYTMTTYAYGMATGSNLSGLVGIVLGIPVGMILGIVAFSKFRPR